MSSPRMVSTREIAGKRITRITYTSTPGVGCAGGVLHSDVAIHLDDGSFLFFVTEEPGENVPDYGIFVGRSLPPTRRRANP